MSYKRGIDIVHLSNNSNAAGRMEFINHPRLMQEITGIDPYDDLPRCEAEMFRVLDMDIALGINFTTPPRIFKDQDQMTATNDKGETISRWGTTGTTFKVPIPLASPEEILDFKPIERTDWLESIPKIQIENWQDSQKLVGDSTLITINFWTTLLHWGTNFPWEYFMEAAYLDPEKFDRLLCDLAHISRQIMSKLAETDAPVVMCHDDLAMGDRTLFAPKWLREKIISKYPMIFEPAKKKGKKILFISDGNISEIAEDLVGAGVDGLVFEPMVNLEWMTKKFGDKIMLIGNADSRILTDGTETQCAAEAQRCGMAASKCGGYAFLASGGIVHNVPMQNVRAYLGAQKAYRADSNGVL